MKLSTQRPDMLISLEDNGKNKHTLDESSLKLPSLQIFDGLYGEEKVSLSPEARAKYQETARNIVELIDRNREFLKTLYQPTHSGLKSDEYIELGSIETLIADGKNLTPEQVQLLGFLERNKNELRNVLNDNTGFKITRADLAELMGRMKQLDLDDTLTLDLLKMSTLRGARSEFARLGTLSEKALSLWGESEDPRKAITAAAVEQGQLGDCYFLSTLASMACSQSGREALQKMISIVKSEDGKASHYMVQFPGFDTPIRVNLPSKAELALYAQENGNGVWVRVLEAAWNNVRNQKDPFRFTKDGKIPSNQGGDDGGQLDEAMKILINTKAERWSTTWTSHRTLKDLLAKAARGEVVVTSGTKGSYSESEQNGSGSDKLSVATDGTVIYSGHAYSLVGFDAENNRVTLRNPHGGNTKIIDGKRERSSAEFNLSYDEYVKYFRSNGHCELK